MTAVDQTLDARGLNCPLPIVKTRKALNALTAGQVLEVTTSNPGGAGDMSAFCKQAGRTLVESGTSGSEQVYVIRKS